MNNAKTAAKNTTKDVRAAQLKAEVEKLKASIKTDIKAGSRSEWY